MRDDGRGFSPDALSRIGDPYISRRERREEGSGGNLGLGLFIAKTLLERSGASLSFSNRDDSTGAVVDIVWPRSAMADGPTARQAPAPRAQVGDRYEDPAAVAAQ